MSGGSWDYVHTRFEQVAERLKDEKCSLRRALGDDVEKLAKAMYAIEWVDSGDCGDGDEIEAIQEFLGHDWAQKQTKVLVEDAKKTIEELMGLIKEVEK